MAPERLENPSSWLQTANNCQDPMRKVAKKLNKRKKDAKEEI